MGIALFVAGNLAAIVAGAGLVDVLRVQGDKWLRATAGLVCYGAAVFVAVALPGATGFLQPWAPVTVAVALAAICLLLAARARLRRTSDSQTPYEEEPTGHLMRLFVAIAVALATAVVARLCFGPTGFAFDDLSYHGPAVAEWIQQGRLTLGAFSYQAYYVHNAELLSLWFALPLGRDALVSLSSAYWVVLLVVAVTALCRQMGARGWLQAVPTLGLLLSHQVVREATRFTPTGLAEAAAIVAAVALIVSALRRFDTATLGTMACAGLAAGMAVGIRSSALPLAAVLALLIIAKVVRGPGRWRWARALVVFVAAAALLGSFWYVRNLMMTGNPVYPAAIGPLDGPFDAATRAETTLIHRITHEDAGATGLAWTAWRLLAWPRPLGLLALFGVGLAIARLIRERQPETRRTIAIVLGLALISALLCPLMPFSGTLNSPDGLLKLGLRYWVVPFALGLALICSARRRWYRGLAPVLSAFLVAAVYSHLVVSDDSGFRSLMLTGLGLGVVGAVWWHGVRRRLWITGGREKTLVAVTVATLIVFGAWSPMKQKLTDAEIFATEGMGEGWAAVNKLPRGSRITWFGPRAYAYYPLYGRDYQFDPVPVFDDGTRWIPLHEREDVPAGWWNVTHHQQRRWGEVRDLTGLVDNLESQDIGWVFTTTYGSDRWPPHGQAEILAESDRAVPVHDDGTNVIWRVRVRDREAQMHGGEELP